MRTLALLQAASAPGWVGPTMALSLAAIALALLAMTVVLIVTMLRFAAQREKFGSVVDAMHGELSQTLASLRGIVEQGQDLMVVVRSEAGALAQTSRHLRRKVVKAVDRVDERLTDLETLYDVVHDEVETTALDVAAALRTARRGGGMLRRLRRFLVAGRR